LFRRKKDSPQSPAGCGGRGAEMVTERVKLVQTMSSRVYIFNVTIVVGEQKVSVEGTGLALWCVCVACVCTIRYGTVRAKFTKIDRDEISSDRVTRERAGEKNVWKTGLCIVSASVGVINRSRVRVRRGEPKIIYIYIHMSPRVDHNKRGGHFACMRAYNFTSVYNIYIQQHLNTIQSRKSEDDFYFWKKKHVPHR